MSLRHTLMSKPWEVGSGEVIERGQICSAAPGKLALTAFFIIITVLFSLLTMGFFTRMASEDWVPLIEPDLLILNTVFLTLSSLAFHGAWITVRKEEAVPQPIGQSQIRNRFMFLGGLFAVAFILGQTLAWLQLYGEGNFVDTNPAITFFILITALHAVHLLGGLFAWGRSALKIWQGASADKIRKSLELCTSYWHFLLLLWMLMFVLLVLDNNGKFDLIAICRGILLGD
ncbi:hypothetical protein [Kiloniella sp.]|uniref:hypothetical protein n=1 Tax=Kiloniella sp. TaxID=1938587 RepID=UPI003B021E3A